MQTSCVVVCSVRVKHHPERQAKIYGVWSSGTQSEDHSKLLVSKRKMTVPQIIYT